VLPDLKLSQKTTNAIATQRVLPSHMQMMNKYKIVYTGNDVDINTLVIIDAYTFLPLS
jgi:hypothetical protein